MVWMKPYPFVSEKSYFSSVDTSLSSSPMARRNRKSSVLNVVGVNEMPSPRCGRSIKNTI